MFSQTNDSALTAELQRLENEFGGHLGVAAKNLKTGEVVAFNAGERFPTASVIKLPIMTAFFDLVDHKLIDPQQEVVLTKEDKKPGLLQFMDDGLKMTLLDAVKLMIVLSENTATNLVLDRLAPTHAERLKVVNDFVRQAGVKNTMLLNRLYTFSTKMETPEAMRYGIGMSTPEDMVLLMEKLYNKTLASEASCNSMLEILKRQEYNDMVPRLLPKHELKQFDVAHKTGWINETKVDVALVMTEKVTYAVAIFIDKHPDHHEDIENRGVLLGAHASRAVWNFFTGDRGYKLRDVVASHVDWNTFPGGNWLIYRSGHAPFPHPERKDGLRKNDGTFYPPPPHYSDSSIVIFVPKHFVETSEGTNLIVHFHGHMNDNMGVLERFGMPQAMVAQKTNALLVLPQGPYRARDSFGGKMEDAGGLKRLIDDVLETMKREEVIKSAKLNKLVVSAHSGGYRPTAYVLDRGGLNNQITDLFLFDAFYGNHDFFRAFLNASNTSLYAAYTDHLKREHEDFVKATHGKKARQLHFIPTSVDHDQVVQTFFADWLGKLGNEWHIPRTEQRNTK
ncbi:MAG: serine hydrolase [Ignavibacteriae bacterium]|nr:serine hydrolase [Ignavibacteriota bacterium]